MSEMVHISPLAKKVYDYEKQTEEELLEIITTAYKSYSKKKSTKKIEKAFEMGKKYHAAQTRDSGAPFFTHPLIVTILLLDREPDEETIIACMLHDTIEDTVCQVEDIESLGEPVVNLVDGLSKIEFKYDPSKTDEENSVRQNLETIRKILQSAEQDMRILPIKLADRLHNVLTLQGKKGIQKQIQKAQETFDIYVPLAKRIGMRQFYYEMKFHCFYYLRNQTFDIIQRKLSSTQAEQEMIYSRLEDFLKNEIKKTKVLQVEKRPKDVHKNVSKQVILEKRAEELFFVEVVVKDVDSCYNLVSEINSYEGDFKVASGITENFITHPKLSGYRALHSNLIIDGKYKVLVHVMSEEMFQTKRTPLKIHQIINIYEDILFKDFDLIDEATASSSQDFVAAVTKHLFYAKIRIHNVKEKNTYVPRNFSVLDTIFYLYPHKAQYTKSAKVNHKEAKFGDRLGHNDILDVEFSDTPTIDISWLRHINSGIIRYRLQNFLKSQSENENIKRGQRLLQEKFDDFHLGDVYHELDHADKLALFDVRSIDEIFILVGEGILPPLEVMEKIGKTSRSPFIKFWHKMRKKIFFVSDEEETRNANLKIAIQSSEKSLEQLHKSLRESSRSTNVHVRQILLKRTSQGHKGMVHVESSSKKDVFDFFLEVEALEHVNSTRTLLSREFKLKTTFVLIFTALSWLAFVLASPYIQPAWAYTSIIIPILANMYAYQFFTHYFPKWRQSIGIFGIIFAINCLAVIGFVFNVYLLKAGQDLAALIFVAVAIAIVSGFFFAYIYTKKHSPIISVHTKKLSEERWRAIKKKKIEGYALRFLAVIVWGIQPLYFKYYISPNITPTMRVPMIFIGMLFISIIALFIFQYFQKTKKQELRLPMNRYFFMMTIGMIGLYILMNSSILRTSGTNFALIHNFSPVVTLIIAVLFWRSEIPYLKKRRHMLVVFGAFLIGSLGSILLFLRDIQLENFGGTLGNIFAVLAMCVDVFLIIGQIRYIQYLRGKPTPLINIYIGIAGSLITLPFIFLHFASFLALTFQEVALALGMGVLVGIGVILNSEAFKRIDGFIAHLMFNISVLITFTAELFRFKTIEPSIMLFVAAILIISASIIAEMVNSRAEKQGL